MALLKIFLFGSPRFELDGVPLRFGLRKVEALLVYLVVNGRRQSRDKLIDLFYPDFDRERSFANFRHDLAVLKKTIGDGQLHIDRHDIEMTPGDSLWVDVREFRLLATRSSDGQDAERSLIAAESMYLGEFLAGFHLDGCETFDEWRFFENEALKSIYTSVLERIVTLFSDRKDYGHAIEYGNKWIAHDPFDEAAHRALMRLHDARGERAAALRQYKRCKEVLARELDSEPGAETEALWRAIRNGKTQPRVSDVSHAPGIGTSTPRRRTNLRAPLTAFIGRKSDYAAVTDLLERDKVRLLTLTGTGGVGKTRLALEAAEGTAKAFEHGVFFVQLAPVSVPDRVVSAIAAALQIGELSAESGQIAADQSSDRRQFERLRDYLELKRMLLILDNFEHLLGAGPTVSELLRVCPKLKILATSREPLHLGGEHVYTVRPLETPIPGAVFESIIQCEAVQLFYERAQAVKHSFTVDRENADEVAKICVWLDGLPLAIELAAARMGIFSLSSLLERLYERSELPGESLLDLPERQRTLERVIDWSFELLAEDQQRVFRRLAVFAGDFSVATAHAICARDEERESVDVSSTLIALYEKNLIAKRENAYESRFFMLQTIGEYASRKLVEAGENEETHGRMVHEYVYFLERMESRMYGAEWKEAFDAIDAEYDNIRSVLRRLLQRRERNLGVRCAAALGWYWFRTAQFSEGSRWLEQFNLLAREEDPPAPRAKLLYHLGWIQFCLGMFLDDPKVVEYLKKSVSLWRTANDPWWLARTLARTAAVEQAFSLRGKDTLFSVDEGPGESVALARNTGDPWLISYCLVFNRLYAEAEDRGSRLRDLDEALRLARKARDSFLECRVLLALGFVYLQESEQARDLDACIKWFLMALEEARKIGDTWSQIDISWHLGVAYWHKGEIDESKKVTREGLLIAVDFGARAYCGYLVGLLEMCARKEGKWIRATRLWGAAAKLLDKRVKSFDQSFTAEEAKRRPYLLDNETGAALWDEGQAMTLDELVTCSLLED